jgi:hypothetical protein
MAVTAAAADTTAMVAPAATATKPSEKGI